MELELELELELDLMSQIPSRRSGPHIELLNGLVSVAHDVYNVYPRRSVNNKHTQNSPPPTAVMG